MRWLIDGCFEANWMWVEVKLLKMNQCLSLHVKLKPYDKISLLKTIQLTSKHPIFEGSYLNIDAELM